MKNHYTLLFILLLTFGVFVAGYLAWRAYTTDQFFAKSDESIKSRY